MKHSSFACPIIFTVLELVMQIHLAVLFPSFLLDQPLPVHSQINTGDVTFNCLVAFHLIRALMEMPTQLPMDTRSALIQNSLVLTQAPLAMFMHPVQFLSPA